MNSSAGKIKSPNKPNTTPDIRIIAMIIAFSFTFLFTLQSTSKPTPAPENRPDIIVPAVISPWVQSVLSATDAAQLGIKPNTAAIRWLINGLSYIIAPRFSSPTKNTSAFIAKVISSTNSDIVAV